MNPEVKVKWLAALRGGEYKQGRGCLRKESRGETRFCCLGVLTDLYIQEYPENGAWTYHKNNRVGERHTYYRFSYDEEEDAVPIPVQEWANIGLRGNFGNSSLVYKNDNGASFKQIANMVEEYF